jgi:endonuclease YncB( thermonuclease family)
LRFIGNLILLAAMVVAAWYFTGWTNGQIPVTVTGQKLIIMDGDSFVLGTRKLRLDGIDAPEYKQTCEYAASITWECGKVARAALEQMLREPGLACVAGAHDRYGRSIATCSNRRLPDIAAAQVANGMAVSHEFYGMRSYGEEEDAAMSAKSGIWVGKFIMPSEWRATHPTLRTNTVPAE